MTLRTKDSVAEGIILHDIVPCVTDVVEYQPGNGTRYLIAFTRLQRPGTRALMAMGFGKEEPAGVVLINWIGRGRSWTMRDAGYLDARYVAEKLDCSVADGAVIAELIAAFTKRTAQPATLAKPATGPPLCSACGGVGKIRDTPGATVCIECGGEGKRRAAP